MTQHSVTPWRDETGTIFAADDMIVCEIKQDFMDEDDNAECLANKRLILAAPQMLEALQAVIKASDEFDDGSPDCEEITLAKAAIAAATNP